MFEHQVNTTSRALYISSVCKPVYKWSGRNGCFEFTSATGSSAIQKIFLSPRSSVSLGKMSGSRVTYYDKELKYLYRLLKNLPSIIPEGNVHNFTNYIPDPQKTKDFGCTKSVVSQALKSSFSWRRTPTGKTIIVSFKSKWLG
jgi:hypothetical protein